MFERLRLEIANLAERQLEKKNAGEGVLFIPGDMNVREISEALFIDGALPSEINRFILDTNPNDVQIKADLTSARLNEIQDSLILEGADLNTTKEVLSASKLEMSSKKKSPILASYNPVKRIDLQVYQES